jgi:hypothetical protein
MGSRRWVRHAPFNHAKLIVKSCMLVVMLRVEPAIGVALALAMGAIARCASD